MHSSRIFSFVLLIGIISTTNAQTWKEVIEKSVTYVTYQKNGELIDSINEAITNEGYPTLSDNLYTYLAYFKIAYEAEEKLEEFEALTNGMAEIAEEDLKKIKEEDGEYSDSYYQALTKVYTLASMAENEKASIYQQEMSKWIMARAQGLTSQSNTTNTSSNEPTEGDEKLPVSWQELATTINQDKQNHFRTIRLFNQSNIAIPDSWNRKYDVCLAYLAHAYLRTGDREKSMEISATRKQYEYDLSPQYAMQRQQNEEKPVEDVSEPYYDESDAESESMNDVMQQVTGLYSDLMAGTVNMGDLSQNDSDVKGAMEQRMDVDKTDAMDAQMDLAYQNSKTMLQNILSSDMVGEDEKAYYQQYLNMADQAQSMSVSERLSMASALNGNLAMEEESLDQMLSQLGANIPKDASVEYKKTMLDSVMNLQTTASRNAINNSGNDASDPEEIRESARWLSEYLAKTGSIDWMEDDHVVALKSIEKNQAFSGTDTEQIVEAFGVEFAKDHDQESTVLAKSNLNQSLNEARKLIEEKATSSLAAYSSAYPQIADYKVEIENDILLGAFISISENREMAGALSDILLDVYADVGSLLGINDLSSLSFNSEKIKLISKNRQAQLNVYQRLIENKSVNFDPFDTLLTFQNLTFDQILQTKDIDYITNKFVYNGIRKSNDSSLKNLYNELRSLRQKTGYMYLLTPEQRSSLNYSETQLDKDLERMNTLEKEVFTQVSIRENYAEFQKEYEIGWKEIQGLLTDKQAFIDIERVSDLKNKKNTTYLACVITNTDKPTIKPIGGEKFYGKENFSIKKKYQSIAKTEDTTLVYNDPWLYNILWSSIDSLLNGKDEIFISTDGVYNYVGLEALYDTATNQFLTDRLKIHRLSMVSDIKKIATNINTSSETKIDRDGEVVLFGNPNFSQLPPLSENEKNGSNKRSAVKLFLLDEPFKAIPGTAIEVSNIHQLLGENQINSSVFIDEQATEEALYNVNNPEVIHLATHGGLNRQRGNADNLTPMQQAMVDFPLLRSQIYLAGAEQSKTLDILPWKDGIVTAEEIFHQDFTGTSLAVLSACETGLGANNISNEFDGVGVFGLARAFQLAGTERVIISLWNAGDHSSKLLMTNMYRNMIEQGQSIREAFFNARMEVKNTYPHPAFWSAFILL